MLRDRVGGFKRPNPYPNEGLRLTTVRCETTNLPVGEVVRHAVSSEPVSTSGFPVLREFTGKFRRE
jgi:hypothetical protein